jgi:hypothetical protein
MSNEPVSRGIQGVEGAAKLQEGQINVGAVLVADLQAPEASLSRPPPLVTPM